MAGKRLVKCIVIGTARRLLLISVVRPTLVRCGKE